MAEIPIITVTVDDDNVVAVTTFVDDRHEIHREVIDLDPAPTWPSPTEQADLVAKDVRDAWLRQHEYYAGSPEPDPEPDMSACPQHGDQVVVRTSSTRGADPYAVDHLACGHKVACFGPGEENVIL